MHYTPGFIAFGGAFSILGAPAGGDLFPLAGFLLDTAGGLFGSYLVLAAGLGVVGVVLRSRARRVRDAPAHRERAR